jgi:hypothetical protein
MERYMLYDVLSPYKSLEENGQEYRQIEKIVGQEAQVNIDAAAFTIRCKRL